MVDELVAPLTSSLAAGPGHLVLTSFHSPSVFPVFMAFPPAVLFLCLFGFPDVAATGYFGNYLGLIRYGEVVVGAGEDNGKLLIWGKENSIYVFQAG